MTAYDLWQYAETKHGPEDLWIGIDSNGFIRICRHGSILEVIKPNTNHG